MPGAPVRRSGRRQPALTPPRPPAHRRFAPPHRRHCSSLHCADRRRPALIHADRRRFTPTDADRSPGIAVVAPPARTPRTAPDAPGTTEPRHPDVRVGSPATRASWGVWRTHPHAGGIEREFARGGAAATAAALHAAQATRQPLHAALPTAAVRPLLGQRPPLRQCRRRPQGKEGATDNGTVTTATAADRRVTTTAATAQRMEKSGGRFAPPRFSPYLAAKQRRPPDASSASGAFARARARQNVRITERMEQRIGGGSAPDVGDPPVIRRHPAGDPRLSAPKRKSSVRRRRAAALHGAQQKRTFDRTVMRRGTAATARVRLVQSSLHARPPGDHVSRRNLVTG